jgi:ABC-type antimicrobial peptide transport system permease subunit
MMNLESFLIWLGGVVFGLVLGFFFKLVIRESKEPTQISTLSTIEVEEKVKDVKKKSGTGHPFF